MSGTDYWLECIEQALEDARVIATQEQVESIAECVAGAHENFGMYYGHDRCGGEPHYREEIEKLKKELRDERDKRICAKCGGSGTIRIDGPCHYSTSDCWQCKGIGRV